MGWLDDLNKKRVYNYRQVDNSDFVISGNQSELNEIVGEGAELKFESGEKAIVLVDGEPKEFEYAGFDSIQMNLTTKVPFEKNGRKGVKTTFGDGSKVVRSQTRENLFKGKGVNITGDKRDAKGNKTGGKAYEVESQLTKGCKEASDKVKVKEVHSRLTGMKKSIEYQSHLAKEKKKGKKR